LEFFVRVRAVLSTVRRVTTAGAARVGSGMGSLKREEGQTTAEYALVILAAAAVAIVLIAWARSSGKLPAFFDNIIDQISQVP
jgi:Flp pilus assembly pilin Flp